MVKQLEAFGEIVGKLRTKYDVGVDPRVIRKIVGVVELDLKELAEKKSVSVKSVQAYFRKRYAKIWCLRQPLDSIDALIVKEAKKQGLELSPNVREELNKLYTSLTADTLFAAAAYAVLTRGRKRHSESATVTEGDVDKVCKDFFILKPHWLC